MKKLHSFLIVIVFMLLLVGCGNKIHKVEFIVNGETVEVQDVKHKESATKPNDPVVDGYTFIEWDTDFTNVKKDLKVNAVLEIKKYIVTFFDGEGNVLTQTEVEHGKSVTAPTLEEFAGHTFKGWSENLDKVKSDLDVYPVYDEIIYLVKFLNEDGSLIKEVKVPYGKAAHAPVAPKKVGYNFIKWDKEFKEVKENLEVKPIYELATYTIKYYDDKTELKDLTPTSYTINSGASIDLPVAPEKEGYEFLGWFDGDERVVTFLTSDAENKRFYAKYNELPKPLEIPSDCTFMFKGIKSMPHSSNPKLIVYQPDFTGLDVPVGATNYTWSSLQPEIATISMWSTITGVKPGYAIIRAQNNSDPKIVGYVVIKVNADGVFLSSIEESKKVNKFTVTFTDENGKVIDTQEVEEYKAATLPFAPVKEGYTFIGWSAEHFNIKENITIEPVYKKGVSDYQGKKVSIIGDSITTYRGYIPDSYASFYPYPTADVKDVNQTWWMEVINNLGMKLLKNNSYAGSCVASGTGASGTTNDDRLKTILDGDEKPDIILIYMGANDCASSIVTLDNFTKSYKVMIDKVKKLAPNALIYLINLPMSKMYNENERKNYNNAIKDISTSYNLPLLDIAGVFPEATLGDYLVDSVHPNKKGMKAMSDKMIKDLLKLKGIE